ncbi:MAG: NAD(P)-dependent alcohol dehydrogenase [Actinomycetales bacterium]|nr:NAD(P)-dependent alcohol dehydrogenase [Actinomycetales bacterium]
MYKTQAAVVREAGGEFTIEDVELDELRSGEVLVRNIATGVCHTDMIIQSGAQSPLVLGHEGAGIIEAVGPDVTTLAVGDKVIMSFDSCGHCLRCLAGRPYHCDLFLLMNVGSIRPDGSTSIVAADGSAIGGNFFGQSSFARHSVANVRNVVKLPEETPAALHRILGPLGCGIMTGSGAVINSLQVTPGSSTVIFGGGGVGLSAMLAALVCGSTTIIVVDINADRLALAKALGATHVIDGMASDVVEQIREITGGGADFSADTTGNMKVVHSLVECLSVGGKAALVGLSAAGTQATIDHNTLILGRSIVGVVEGDAVPQVFIPHLIDLHLAGKFAFDKLIKEYDFADINTAFHDSHTGDTIKGIVVF